MAQDLHVGIEAVGSTPAATPEDPSLTALFKALAQDSATLVRQEMALAKSEMRENVRGATRDVVKIAAGGALLLVGVLVLTAFLVVLLGDVLDNYWLGALIVGAVYVGIGGPFAMNALKGLKQDDLAPEQTIQTLKEDKQWLQNEMQEARKELA